jgi:phosphoglucosamine mutase
VISASHNPYEDNGVKVFGHDGMKLSDDLELQIEQEMLAIRREDSAIPAGQSPLEPSEELIARYESFLLSSLGAAGLEGRKVVLDVGFGAAYRIAPDVFRRAGADVRVINDTPDGTNINLNAGALHPEGLGAAVREANADFGVAFDGDADRAIFVDDRGDVRNGDEIIYLWALENRRRGLANSDTVVTTVMSNLGFERALKGAGIRLLRAAVGDKYVLEMMLENKAILGGEQSGHIIDLTVHSTGDGIHTALMMGEILTGSGRKFSAIPTFTPSGISKCAASRRSDRWSNTRRSRSNCGSRWETKGGFSSAIPERRISSG